MEQLTEKAYGAFLIFYGLFLLSRHNKVNHTGEQFLFLDHEIKSMEWRMVLGLGLLVIAGFLMYREWSYWYGSNWLHAAGLLCGFAAPPAEENADLVPRQFQTAQQIDRISVEDAISNVTIRTADTDHITVDYADTTEKPLYTISVEDGLLSIQTTTEEFEGKNMSLFKIRMDGKTVSGRPDHDLVITLPQKQYQELSVALAVGTLSVEGVKASQLTAEFAVNTVKLSGIQADQLNTASAVGQVTVRDSQIGNAEIDGAVGGVVVKNVTASGQVTVSNAVGSVSMEDVTAHELIVQSALGCTSYKNVKASYSSEAGIFNWSSGAVARP